MTVITQLTVDGPGTGEVQVQASSGCQHGWRGPAGGGRAGKDRAGGANTGRGGAQAGKDRAGGSSTGALCTRFTLVTMEEK